MNKLKTIRKCAGYTVHELQLVDGTLVAFQALDSGGVGDVSIYSTDDTFGKASDAFGAIAKMFGVDVADVVRQAKWFTVNGAGSDLQAA